MSDNPNNADKLQPSWAAHELFALGLTLLLTLWITVKYGGNTAPADHRDARAADRATKRAELAAADEKALGSYDVIDAENGVYRVPIRDAMTAIKKTYLKKSSFSELTADRLLSPEQIGAKLFLAKSCFTCHQTDPAVPAPAGLALKAPKFIGDFWGKEREVQLDADPATMTFEPSGKFATVKMDEEYFLESVEKPMAKIVKGAIPGMAPLPTTLEERMALMAYVRSLSK